MKAQKNSCTRNIHQSSVVGQNLVPAKHACDGAPTIPSSIVETSPITRIAVKDFITLSSKPLHSDGKHARLAVLCVIALDHPHSAKRLCKPSRDLGVDLAAFTEDRANRFKRLVSETNRNKARSPPRSMSAVH